jgi:hypothetical protein
MKDYEFVVTRLFGGLGNQIFQYMAGKWLATELRCNLKLDVGWVNGGYTHSNSSISDFKMYESVDECEKKNLGSINQYLERTKTVLARKSAIYSQFSKIHAPASPGFSDISKLKPGAQLRGYYQTPRFFSELMEYGAITLEDFGLMHPSQTYFKFESEIPNSGFLAVHVRGGDYLGKNSIYRQLGPDYYQTGLKAIQSEYPNLPIWIFTDDQKFTKSFLFSNTSHTYVDSESLSPAETLKLMSHARAIVCANSTFSYWASMISKSETMVVAPSQWLKTIKQDADFFPKSWTLL